MKANNIQTILHSAITMVVILLLWFQTYISDVAAAPLTNVDTDAASADFWQALFQFIWNYFGKQRTSLLAE